MTYFNTLQQVPSQLTLLHQQPVSVYRINQQPVLSQDILLHQQQALAELFLLPQLQVHCYVDSKPFHSSFHCMNSKFHCSILCHCSTNFHHSFFYLICNRSFLLWHQPLVLLEPIQFHLLCVFPMHVPWETLSQCILLNW